MTNIQRHMGYERPRGYDTSVFTFLRVQPPTEDRSIVFKIGMSVWAFNDGARVGVARPAVIVGLNPPNNMYGTSVRNRHARHKWLVRFKDERKFAWHRGAQPCSTLRLVPRMVPYAYFAVGVYCLRMLASLHIGRILDFDRVTPPPSPERAPLVELLQDVVRLPGASAQALILLRSLSYVLATQHRDDYECYLPSSMQCFGDLSHPNFKVRWGAVLEAAETRLNVHRPTTAFSSCASDGDLADEAVLHERMGDMFLSDWMKSVRLEEGRPVPKSFRDLVTFLSPAGGVARSSKAPSIPSSHMMCEEHDSFCVWQRNTWPSSHTMFDEHNPR